MKQNKNILWFRELSIKDIPLVGGKNASLGEMYCQLKKKGVPVPDGFAVTARAYNYFLKKAGIRKKIFEILKGATKKNIPSRAKQIRHLILAARLPEDLQAEIIQEYKRLSAEYKAANLDVAVRSSATAEDLPGASFAGQQESFLNISGEQALLDAVKKCFASLFTDRAVSYRIDQGFRHEKVSLSVGVQKMVRSDLASAGVMFTLDTESGNSNVILINAAFGLGEFVVKGVVNPDEYYVFKQTLSRGYKPIVGKTVGDKAKKLVYSHNPFKPTQSQPVPLLQQKRYVLADEQILQLAKYAMIIEKHYKRPMDIEWAVDGRTQKLFIVQARPETIASRKNPNFLEEYILTGKSKVILTGSSVGMKIGSGRARVIRKAAQLSQFKAGEVLVAEMTDPDWEPIMKKAAAIITDAGGRTCHAAIVSRELGVPCIVGAAGATKKIKTGAKITVNCSEGEIGKIHDGLAPFKIKKTNLKRIKRSKTKIMMNVGNPYAALGFSFIPNDGVGLAREEFIIANYIKIHPLALLNYGRLKDKKAKAEIADLTVNHPKKPDFFVDKLAEGVGMIAAAFYPKDVIIRLSDFKSNEYANLIGGEQFEPAEPNPMIGWRGASRYYTSAYEPAFALECRALKKAREQFGLKNIKIMIPFCRTLEEGRKVIALLKKYGLERGREGLEVYVMCEIPSNVLLADKFFDIFDGFSIGSNDLTQLTLGVDRDSQLVSQVYDENNDAVKLLISLVIEVAKARKRKIGICGQAPSDFPDFARFLVGEGIDSISLNPDTVLKTTLAIADEEKKMKRRRK